jgi:hypothetical protein
MSFAIARTRAVTLCGPRHHRLSVMTTHSQAKRSRIPQKLATCEKRDPEVWCLLGVEPGTVSYVSDASVAIWY